jgi:hypothetical protein
LVEAAADSVAVVEAVALVVEAEVALEVLVEAVVETLHPKADPNRHSVVRQERW